MQPTVVVVWPDVAHTGRTLLQAVLDSTPHTQTPPTPTFSIAHLPQHQISVISADTRNHQAELVARDIAQIIAQDQVQKAIILGTVHYTTPRHNNTTINVKLNQQHQKIHAEFKDGFLGALIGYMHCLTARITVQLILMEGHRFGVGSDNTHRIELIQSLMDELLKEIPELSCNIDEMNLDPPVRFSNQLDDDIALLFG